VKADINLTFTLAISNTVTNELVRSLHVYRQRFEHFNVFYFCNKIAAVIQHLVTDVLWIVHSIDG